MSAMKRELIMLSTVVALVGCASSGMPKSTEESLKLYEANSTPVESFRITKLQGGQSRWTRLGDQALVVWDASDQPHLLQLPEKCSGLGTAISVALTNTSGTVTPGTDFVQ